MIDDKIAEWMNAPMGPPVDKSHGTGLQPSLEQIAATLRSDPVLAALVEHVRRLQQQLDELQAARRFQEAGR